jgi:dihydroneopterin aldolase
MLPAKLVLQGMVFYGYHGNHPEEQRLGQRFVVDVEITADVERVAETDRLEDAVDLGQVYRLVKEMVEGEPRRLLEALVMLLCRSLLERFPCQAVTVRVKKPNVPIPGPLDYEGVELTLERTQ